MTCDLHDLRAEIAPLKSQIDAAFSDFARAIATEINGVKAENATLKARHSISLGRSSPQGQPRTELTPGRARLAALRCF